DEPLSFFFQAEDGIRDRNVTGVQTCALPIYGGLTAHPGGDRWRWEQRIFGGAYDGAPARERPKYGALNHRRNPLGGAPRFGSSRSEERRVGEEGGARGAT